ncbi:hypothetical protein SAMN05428981_1106 [Bacillus sp. OV194]|nr:hypothetical protein SAMN05428981_1106 [Bacillus sp. OV194]
MSTLLLVGLLLLMGFVCYLSISARGRERFKSIPLKVVVLCFLVLTVSGCSFNQIQADEKANYSQMQN